MSCFPDMLTAALVSVGVRGLIAFDLKTVMCVIITGSSTEEEGMHLNCTTTGSIVYTLASSHPFEISRWLSYSSTIMNST